MKIVLVAIYSEKFAMIGESHGVSVIAGVLYSRLNLDQNSMLVLDMYAYDQSERDINLIDKLKEYKPDIIGFSCPYGSFEYLKNIYPKILESINYNDPLIIFSGALPTYIPDSYLLEIDKNAFVIVGEGEEAIYELITNRKNTRALSSINNICYIDVESRQIVHTTRKQVDLLGNYLPYREHLPLLLEKRAQIFVENSRGCAWGKCTFCSRKMYSDDSKDMRYRRLRCPQKIGQCNIG